jgi:hypothetical protein
MNSEAALIKHLELCGSFKTREIKDPIRPEILKEAFKKFLSLKNPYWDINPDSDKLTKLVLIFKPSPTFIDKGKPIYVGIQFNTHEMVIILEEQYVRTEDNTFAIPYAVLLEDEAGFKKAVKRAFIKAHHLANGNRDREVSSTDIET